MYFKHEPWDDDTPPHLYQYTLYLLKPCPYFNLSNNLQKVDDLVYYCEFNCHTATEAWALLEHLVEVNELEVDYINQVITLSQKIVPNFKWGTK